MVKRTTGELLVLTTWDDDETMAAGLAADRTHRANLAERTGLAIRASHTMEVLGSTDAELTGTPAARWVHATRVQGPAPAARSGRCAVERPPTDEVEPGTESAERWLHDVGLHRPGP